MEIKNRKILDTDILIIGGGTAGCYAALTIAEQSDAKVIIAEKANIKRSGCLAAGVNAINAYIVEGRKPEDYVDYAKKDADGIVREDLLLTMSEALRIGAKGYCLKQDFAAIVPSLNAVMSGQSVFGGEIVNKLPVLMQNKESFDYASYDISEKEQEIIHQVALGRSNKEIAEALFLSEGTVRNYISSTLEKLSLRDRTQLAVFYYQHL